MSDRDFKAVTSALEAETTHDGPMAAVLIKVLSAIGSNNFAELPSHFTEDIELHIHGFPGMDGAWRGRPRVLQALEQNFGKVEAQKTSTESMVCQGVSIALLITETGRLKVDGRAYHVRGVIWFLFAGERIKRVEEFLHENMIA